MSQLLRINCAYNYLYTLNSSLHITLVQFPVVLAFKGDRFRETPPPSLSPFVPQLQSAFFPIEDRHALSPLPRCPQRLHHQRHCDGRIREYLHLGSLSVQLAPGYASSKVEAGQPAPVRRVRGVLNGIAVAARVVAHHRRSLLDEVLGHAPANIEQGPGY